MSEQKKILPAVALRGMTVMPEMVVHFDISRERSVKACLLYTSDAADE